MTRTQIVPAGPHGDSVRWEDQYRATLERAGKISQAGINEIRRCTEEAFEYIGDAHGPRAERSVNGAVVGAVQSGKTGLMINLSARALDSGFRFVVVLAGLRDDLRTQTALRFLRDLLQRGDAIPEDLGGGFTHPLGPGYHGDRKDCWAPLWRDDVNHDPAFSYLLAKTLRQGGSALAIAKKNVTTLNALRAAYEYALGQVPGGHVPMLVIDDESDEASVSAHEEAPTPDRIAAVWSGLEQQVAYVGFTATPAANLLQDPRSQLFPWGFVLTLRTSGDADTTLSYAEPDPDKRYTGGQTFYQMLDSHHRSNFLLEAAMSDQEFAGVPTSDDELERALLAYFVGGAIRLVEQGLPRFDDAAALPEPHTMLAHTESSIASHWRLCGRIVHLIRTRGGERDKLRRNIARVAPRDRISGDHLARWLESEPEAWRAWHTDFRRSRQVLLEVSPDRIRSDFPRWEDVHAALHDVFQHVELRVVNSDDDSVDAPLQFQPTYVVDGIRPPRDVYSIVIGGNRLSRGLTLEGLCVSYYTRSSNTLVEDTTVQRERWFGYRGHHLEFCRLFTHRSLGIRLRRFHEHDEDLRRQLAWNVQNGRSPANATYRFLTIRDSVPTAKQGRGYGPLRLDMSGARVFIDRVQMGKGTPELIAAGRNQEAALAIAENVLGGGEPLQEDRGYVRKDVSPEEVSDYLDRFVYSFHNPDPNRGIGWNLRSYYRSHDASLSVTGYGFLPSSDPFLLAAYLRFWGAACEECRTDPTTIRFRAADGVSDWRPRPPPAFNVALRYGTLAPDPESPFAHRLLNREVDGDGYVGSRWGGRRGGVGDEWIDIPPGGNRESPRDVGQPGLMLLHVIGRQARGLKGYGEPYPYDRPCVGLVIPEGGPALEVVMAEAEG